MLSIRIANVDTEPQLTWPTPALLELVALVAELESRLEPFAVTILMRAEEFEELKRQCGEPSEAHKAWQPAGIDLRIVPELPAGEVKVIMSDGSVRTIRVRGEP